jgi:hypothetical protein
MVTCYLIASRATSWKILHCTVDICPAEPHIVFLPRDKCLRLPNGRLCRYEHLLSRSDIVQPTLTGFSLWGYCISTNYWNPRGSPHLSAVQQPPVSLGIMSEHVWDTFDTYRLNQADLEDFPKNIFGNLEFYTSVSTWNTHVSYRAKACRSRLVGSTASWSFAGWTKYVAYATICCLH